MANTSGSSIQSQRLGPVASSERSARRGLNSSNIMSSWLVLRVQPYGPDIHRAAVRVVGGLGNTLTVQRYPCVFGDIDAIVGFHDGLRPIIQFAVPNERAMAACCQIIAMGA